MAGNSSSRRWIQTWAHDTTGRLTDSYSVKACTSYTDSTHVVTTNTTAGMRHKFTYDSNSALSTVKLRNPLASQDMWQRKKVFGLQTSGDRRRFLKTQDTSYAIEHQTEGSAGAITTTLEYTYHTADTLAVKSRRTVLPAVQTSENGSGSSLKPLSYFEQNGRLSWSRDADDYVQYMAWDTTLWTVTKRVVDVNTASLPTDVPSPPAGDSGLPGGDPGFSTPSGGGLNLVTDYQYDYLRRPRQAQGTAFNAWDGTSIVSVQLTRKWYYTKLSGGEAVTVEYPHLGSSYVAIALNLTVRDFDGHVRTSAQGQLTTGDTNLDNDVDTADSTIQVAFNGTILKRTDFTFSGDKLEKEEVWTDADNGSGAKLTTEHTFDASGRRLTTKNPAGTITRWSYNVLGRVKTQKVGTVDGGGSDNMTLVEDRFYDDEEDTSTFVGDGNLTCINRYTSYLGSARNTAYSYDYRNRLTSTSGEEDYAEARGYTNRNQLSSTETIDSGTLDTMARTEYYYDAWGQGYDVRTRAVTGGDLETDTKYSNTLTWRNGRGQVIKTRSRGQVFEKNQYDGAGRVMNRGVSYDGSETTYAQAKDFASDTVVEQTRYAYDAAGGVELARFYQRRHDGTGTDNLTVGTSGNGRAQYTASWYDPFHRARRSVNYGTNAGTDLSSRPTGSPPGTDSTHLSSEYLYTVRSELSDAIDPMVRTTKTVYDDVGRVFQKFDNYQNGTPGDEYPDGYPSDDDRKVEYTYDSYGRLQKVTAKLAGLNDDNPQVYVDLVTEYVFGVLRGTSAGDSLITSNDLLKQIKHADPSTGQPSSSATDHEFFAHSAQGELIWKKDQAAGEHIYEFDGRGRLIHDRVTVLGTNLDGAIRRISITYDVLDRPLKVTSVDNATVGSGTVNNEVLYEYDRYSTVSKIYQEWTTTVSISTSRKVQYAYSFPTSGATAVRRTSCTYTDGTVVTDEYNSGMDDTLSRLSGRKISTTWQFKDSYLGLGRLVRREYGGAGSGIEWTLVGTDSTNNDNYVGLDYFGRIDDLIVKNGSGNINRYVYTYNSISQVTVREDKVGKIGTSYEFSETWEYDNLGRVVDHRRGVLSGTTIPTTIRLHECWVFDRSGNILDFCSGILSTCQSACASTFYRSNELKVWGSGTAAYDDPGNLTQKGIYTMKYDAWNRLVYVKWSTIYISHFYYNGMNQKIKRTDPTPAVYYYYGSESQALEERKTSDGTVHNSYVWGTQYIDDLVVSRPSGVTKYSALDHNFNSITRIASSGSAEARYHYARYGEPTELSADWTTPQTISADHYLFTSRQWHKDPMMYDFRNRTQDPEVFRFLQRDPIGIWGDDGNFGNGYAYVGNDPGNSKDPIGLCQVAPDNRTVVITGPTDMRSEVAYSVKKDCCSIGGNVHIERIRLLSTPDDNSIDVTDMLKQIGWGPGNMDFVGLLGISWEVVNEHISYTQVHCSLSTRGGAGRQWVRTERLNVIGREQWLCAPFVGCLRDEYFDAGSTIVTAEGPCCPILLEVRFIMFNPFDGVDITPGGGSSAQGSQGSYGSSSRLAGRLSGL